MKRLTLALALSSCLALPCASAAPVISEFMASNQRTLADNDGAFSDWIELRNPDSSPVDLTGWYLTDNASRKTKWQFPAVTLPAGGHLIVFASDKDRRDPAAPLHTNFALSADGEYLGLIAADGVTIVSEFAPTYPSQSADVAYGIASSGAVGFLGTPTPGAANAAIAGSTVTLTAADGATSTFASGMPILVLDNAGAGAPEQVDGEKEGTLELISGGSRFTSAAGLSVRGSSSAEFPKKSFSLELHDETGANRSASLLGMAKVADWALIGAWHYDPSHLRNAFLYGLSNSIGRWAPKTRFAEVFLKTDGAPLGNAHYYGIGVLTERLKIDEDLIALQPLSATDTSGDAVTGGYLLKIDPQDDDEFGWTTERGIPEGIDGGTKLVIASPKAAKLADEQRDYIRDYVQAFEDALFTDRDNAWATRGYLDYIDRASWVDYHLLQVLAKNPDGLSRSVYFTKDRGGKLKAGPVWDFDRAMGSMDIRSSSWDEWYEPTDGTPLWSTGWWGVLADDPDYLQAWVDRWQSLRRDAFTNARMTSLVRSLAAQIDPAAAARDSARWPDNEIRFARHAEEVDLLVSWLAKRADWIDRQFIAPPIAVVTPAGTQISAPAGFLIAYTLDGSDPRASGGKASGSATLVADTLLVPAGATAMVRIFNPGSDLPEIGSPWSSPATVKGAAPSNVVATSAAPQLAALSTHAVLTGPGATFSSTLVVAGNEKTFVVRAVGRTLATLGFADALLDPVLHVVADTGAVVASNRSWRDAPDVAALAQRFAAVGAFPLLDSPGDGRDAALEITLAPGTYRLEVASESGARGVVLAEAYTLDAASRVPALAVRTVLGAGESFASAFAVQGNEPRLMLIRAIGSAADPALELFAGAQSLGSNDSWSYAPNAGEVASAAVAAGATPLRPGSSDAALLVRLPPGTFTVRTTANFSAPDGVLLEILQLP